MGGHPATLTSLLASSVEIGRFPIVILCGCIIAVLIPRRRASPRLVRGLAIAVGILVIVVFLGRLLTDIAVLEAGTLPQWDSSVQAIAGAWLNGQALYPPVSSGVY